MSDTLLEEVNYNLGELINDIALSKPRWTMSYDHFLAARRPLIAGVIRQDHLKLAGTAA